MRARRLMAPLLAALLALAACDSVTLPGADREDGRPAGRTTGPGTPGDTGPRLSDDGRVGSMGPALLSDAIARVRVEIDTADEGLTDRARSAIRETLERHGRKRSVEFAGASTVPAERRYSAGDLRRIEGRHRSTRSGGETASVYVLVLPGEFEDGDALGVAYGASSFAIFPDKIRGALLASLTYARFEEAVVVHELGHLFGLVDLTGKGDFHEDREHPGHSRNRESVMFWAVEDVSIANVFRGGPPTDFDADDRREMDRIRAEANG